MSGAAHDPRELGARMAAAVFPPPRRQRSSSLFDPSLVGEAIGGAFLKLNPLEQIRNPVMFTVLVVAVFTSMLWLNAAAFGGEAPAFFIFFVSIWLWITVLFANFAEALAEGRGRAQAAQLRRTRSDLMAWKLDPSDMQAPGTPVPASDLRRDDLVRIDAGEFIPGDGEVVEGIASVDESAVTGESAPVIRESGGDRSAVTGGTRVLSDWIIVRITANPGDSFLDRMIDLVESARRQKTPNEIALDILLAAMSLIFLLACATLLPFSSYAATVAGRGSPISITALAALLVCLIPTTIGGLLSAIRIAGMDRLLRANVIATSGRAVEAAGDIDVLLLDKTGTITLGNRQASAFMPVPGVSEQELAEAAQLASLADETPEGRSIVVLAKRYGLREQPLHDLGASFIPFTAQSRMSGVRLRDAREIRKGALDGIEAWVLRQGGAPNPAARSLAEAVSRRGSTPLVVATGDGRTLGVVELKDIVKGGIAERFAELRRMGIRTVMITGDNPITAAAIAAEAGVDDVLAQATPERKLELIRSYQHGGRLVAMTGDGTNDAPALAQADVAVAMNSGTQAAKEAGNMVDLDSNPTKLIEIVRIGKQLLMTRGALTTFSIANDVAKYFAIIPAIFVATYPALASLDVMRLDPRSAIVSAVIFNALIIVALVPLAMRGVSYRPVEASKLLRRNLLLYGCGGLLAPFVGIKLIDLLLIATGVARWLA